MNFIIKSGILFWMICNILTTVTIAQDLKETLKFADSQFESGNYKLALKEYQRVLFFNDGSNLQYIYEQIGSSFFFKKDFKKAAYYYELSYKTAKSESIKTEILFKKAACYMLDKNFKLATFELMNLPDSLDLQSTNRKNFYFAVCYWGLEDFEKSKSSFLNILPIDQVSARKEITLLFSKKRNLEKPNPKTAQILSIFLPGSGQIYSGDVKNGINSLALTGGIVLLGVYMTRYYSLFDAVLTVFPWFIRYHQGGYQGAKEIAQNKRAKKRNDTYQNILKVIQESSIKTERKAKEGY
ncbi:MAG: hypothetical protein ABFS35_04585 [Bacteroidota bacterium]